MLSIIVPVYNAEKCLGKTLQCVLEQHYQDWECVLINDGSTDKSLQICEAFAAQDSRFVVISKENGGVSSARNMGLNVAKGAYVAFLDCDDNIDAEMYASMLTAMEQDKCDLANCLVVSEEHYTSLQHSSPHYDVFAKPLEYFYDDSKMMNSVCNKVFAKAIIGDVRFAEDIHYAEDSLFMAEVLLCSTKIAFTEERFYHYIRNSSSASNKHGTYALWGSYVATMHRIYTLLCQKQCSENILLASYTKYGRAIFSLLRLAIQDRDEQGYNKYRAQYLEDITRFMQEAKLSLGSKLTYWTYYHGYSLASLVHYYFRKKR